MKSVLLTITERCNLSCTYCYEHNKGIRDMPMGLAKQLIVESMEWNSHDEELEISFHGGEPFVRAQWMIELCEWTWEKYPLSEFHYHFFVTTNGTLLTEETKNWLWSHRDRFICCLSIDGDKEMQDKNRSKSFDLIDIQFLKKTWPDQEVKLTVSEETVSSLSRGIIWLHEQGFKVADNLAYGIDWSDACLANELGRELAILAAWYLEHPDVKPCRLVSYPIEQLAYTEPPKRACGIGPDYRAFYVDGIEYPCHFFQPNSVGIEKAEASIQLDFSEDALLDDPDCEGCRLISLCPTCYGSNYYSSGVVWRRDKSLCPYVAQCARASAWLYIHKIERYGVESLRKTDEGRKALVEGLRTAISIGIV